LIDVNLVSLAQHSMAIIREAIEETLEKVIKIQKNDQSFISYFHGRDPP